MNDLIKIGFVAMLKKVRPVHWDRRVTDFVLTVPRATRFAMAIAGFAIAQPNEVARVSRAQHPMASAATTTVARQFVHFVRNELALSVR
jgi:hypothetical protein